MAEATENALEYVVKASHLNKAYDGNLVVNDASLTIKQGEILGLIGPNGAGKTTIIRMLMDIIKPDSGSITIMGKAMNEAAKNQIGYLPEERGLYRKLTVNQTLTYLAALKNCAPTAAKKRAEELLTQTGMLPYQNKKIEELSKGMGQLIQVLTTIVHNPQLVILDEPFSGLDPVNTELVKEIVLELREEGKGVILSTHMMNQVENLCDRIMMLNKGRTVLYGELNEIKSRYRDNSLLVESENAIGDIKGVTMRRNHGKCTELFLEEEYTPQMILEELVKNGIHLNRFEVSTPSLNEIFIRVVEQGNNE